MHLHPLFTRALVVRSAGLWLGVRLSIAALGLPMATLLLPIGLLESVLIVAATLVLANLELERRGELLLLASMGSGREALLLLSAAPVVPLELSFSYLIVLLG